MEAHKERNELGLRTRIDVQLSESRPNGELLLASYTTLGPKRIYEMKNEAMPTIAVKYITEAVEK